MMKSLCPSDIENFQQNGAICLRNVLSSDAIECLKQGIDLNLKHPSSRAKIASLKNDPGLFIEDFCNWQSNPFYKEFIFSTNLAEIAGLLMKSSTVRLYHDHTLVKEANTRQKTPWHQDQPYYNIEGMQNCSMWIPVDPVSRESTLEFIAGSHRGPWLIPRTFMDHQAKWFPEGSLSELPDIEAEREKFPILGWDMNPGDIVCFHMLTLHAAKGVEGGQRRRVYSLRFIGDDITHAPRSWVTYPHFADLEKDLDAGAKMEHELFPLLWKQT